MSFLRRIWGAKEIRNGILFTLAVIAVFRVAAHIPVPGVNVQNLRAFFESNQILGLVNLFSGGAMENFSIVALGVGPYITASIIFQLLGMIVPRIEEIQKEPGGQERINQWTRLAMVPLALLQAFGTLTYLRQSGQGIVGDLSAWQVAVTMLVMTAGSVFLVWLGELISLRKIGNGVSIIIFAGIIAQLPITLSQAFATFDSSQALNWAAYAAIALFTIAGVVFITEGQRNIPVIYARHQRGMRGTFGGAQTHLPLRVNMSGVVPIIFAVSVVLFPPMIAQFFVRAKTAWIASIAQWVVSMSQNQTVYSVSFFLLVFFFTYFYTAVVFNPERVAENIQKQGGFVPGIRPGRPTAEYLMRVVNRITPAGAAFLAVIAVLPLVVQRVSGTASLAIGGTSLLIVVSVVIEIVNQINAQLSMRDYDML